MKKFNKGIFLNSTVVVGLLLIPCFIAAWTEYEGTLGNSILPTTLSKLFYILRFPTHTLFWEFFSQNGNLFFTGLFLNCMFFGLTIERSIYLLKQITSKPQAAVTAEIDQTIKCQFCDKNIASFIDDKMNPSFEQCYKLGNVPVPNFGWLCSQNCATEFEIKYDVKFSRTKDGKVDYYDDEFKTETEKQHTTKGLAILGLDQTQHQHL